MATIVKKGLTFSDVLLIPKKTPLNSRSEANVKTRVTKNIALNIPLVSANMASVTESAMAIALAREGGIGIIHQFLTIEDQAEEVRKVKRSTSHVVLNPITATKDLTLAQAKEIMQLNSVTSLIIINDNQEVEGVLTNRDYEFENNDNQPISNLITPSENLITSTPTTTIEEAKEIMSKNKVEKLILTNNNNQLAGLITLKDIRKKEDYPNAIRDKRGRLLAAGAVGVKDTIERAKALIDAGCDMLTMDIAHAHSDLFIKQLKALKEAYPNTDVLVGNIATKEAALDLIEAGADGLKIGIGPSPVCTTRVTAGSGIPQITAIMDVYEVAKQHNIPICADGGITHPGDISKAIAAGADTIMNGSIFAGCDESPTPIINHDGKKIKKYFGSASFESAMNRKELKENKRVKKTFKTYVEGVSKYVDYRGSTEETIDFLIRGLQSGISYCGATNIKELQENAEFIEITSASWQESLPRK